MFFYDSFGLRVFYGLSTLVGNSIQNPVKVIKIPRISKQEPLHRKQFNVISRVLNDFKNYSNTLEKNVQTLIPPSQWVKK